MNVFISDVGEINTIGDVGAIEGLGPVTRRRASEILPVNRFKRAAFVGLRAMFGERGRVAEWTRQWQGPWTARLLDTGETFTAQSRRIVLRWEHHRLENKLTYGP